MRKGSWIVFILLILSSLALIFVFKEESKYGLQDELADNQDVKINWDINSTEQTTPQDATSKRNPKIGFENLKNEINKQEGTYGLYITDLINKTEYEMNSTQKFLPLSLYKLPLIYAAVKKIEQEDLKWDETITYTKEDYFDGFGSIATSGVGSEYSVEKVIELMLRESDNSGQQMIKNLLGDDYIEEEFKKISDDRNTTIFHEEGTTTPLEFSNILGNIFYKNNISQENKDKLLSFMYPTTFDIFIIPYLNENLVFYHKVGISENSYHDCGIVKGPGKELIVCLMSQETNESNFDNVCKLVGEFLNTL